MATAIAAAEKEALVRSAEEMAQAIERISDGLVVLRSSRLSERAVLVLLHDATGLPMRDIKSILEAGSNLRHLYLKKQPAK